MSFSRQGQILRMRLRSLTQRGALDRELEKELRFHLDQQREENLLQGQASIEAELAALRALGGISQIQEECRDMRRTNHLSDCLQDLRYAGRSLARSPGFAIVIVLTMALAIGANSAIFSVIHGVLLKPLPYAEPHRLVRVYLHSASFPKFPVNPFDFRDYRDRSRSFESMAAYTRRDVQLSGTGQPVRLSGFAVTSGFFRVLGLQPAIGREFSTADELPGSGRVVVLSNKLWRAHFGARPDIVGQKIELEGMPFTVVGVMRPGVEHPGNAYKSVAFGETVELWIPFHFEGNPSQRGSHYLDCVGRLKNGATIGQAQSELNAVMAQLAREHEGDRNWQVMTLPLQSEIVGRSRPMLLVLLGAVSLVLLIACVNSANLLLARATARQREIAIRSAMGARRSRLIRQLLTESVLISLIGAALGACIAVAGVKALVSLLPAGFPRSADIHVNGIIFLFTLGVAIATGILFGLAPALQGSKTDLRRPLHEGSRSTTSSSGSLRLRSSLVVSEVALACVLLIGAGLMLRSFVNLLHTDPGFRPERVLTATVTLPNVRYKTTDEIARFYDRLVNNLAATPGISAVGVGSDLPWTGWDDNAGGFQMEGRPLPPGLESHARYHVAGADYFRALGIPLLQGRFFTAHDTKAAAQTLIINQSMARRYWQRESALGKRITFADKPKESDWMTIVGIVGDVKDTPASSEAEPGFWWPIFQQPFQFPQMSLAVRANSDPAGLAAQIRGAVSQLDPNLAVAEVRLMDEVTDNSYATSRFALFLVGLFALLAITLAAIGAYGVISYSVNQRRHEFGIRMALGAKPGDVMTGVLRDGMKLALAGTLAGVLFGLAFGKLIGSLLYQVSSGDPLSIVAACAVALVTSAIACYVPARRATQNDPMTALRAD